VTVFRRILRTLGWGAGGLLVVAFLVGYAAPYLSPTRFWWTDLVAVFLPPLGVGVGLVGLGLFAQGAYRRTWGRVVVSVVLLALLGVRFGPRLAAWAPPRSTAADLRVMTFNVPSAFAAQAPAAATTLATRTAPDILAFQESRMRTGATASPPTLVHASPSIRSLLADSIGYRVPQALPPNTKIQQPVIGRFPIDSLSVHPLPPAGDTDARSQYTRIQFSWQGDTAVLYNVHLHTVGSIRPWSVVPEWPSLARWRAFLRTYREGALRRAQQARLIRRRLAREPHPVIVVGDFNSTPHQWAYRHIAQGLQSAATRRIRGWTATFPAQQPLVRIDHVLAGPAWRITAAQVPAPLDPPISDHRPVVAQLRWKR
jgi:endonuclease/exonuclease/phosphatase family metal-dependent hydrolase